MDAEENPSAPSSSSSSSSSSRARNRRPSPTISSTTSPAFPTPHQQQLPGHRRLAPSSLQISLNSSNNNRNNNNRDVDDDNACQPSSSTATFTPPSPRARLGNSAATNARSASPMGSPDSTFWAPSPIASNFRASHAPISNNRSASSNNNNNASAHNNGPATPGGTCEVSSSTVNDVPPSPIQFHSSSSSADELNGVTNSSSSNNNNNSSSSSSSNNNNVMLLPLRTSSSNSSSVPSTSRGLLLNSLNNNHAVNSAASTSSTRSDSALKFSFSRSKIKKASSFERFSQQAANNINNITNTSNNSSSSSNSNSNNNDIAGANTEALNGSSSTATTQGLNIPGLNNNNNSSIVGASTSNNSDRAQGNLTDGGAVAGTSSSAAATSVLQATLSSGSLTSNSSTSNSSTSHSSVMLWDAIFKSSGANALRQIFSNSGPSSDKSLHTKIPSKKLAAKIASVFEQEEQQQQLQLQQQQQQQNELMNSLINQPTTGSHENLSNHAHHQGTNNAANSNNLNSNNSNSLNNNNSLNANNSSLNSNNSSLNLPTNPHMDDPVASMELDDVNLMRELSESPLNLTETSANTSSLGLKSSRASGGTYAHTSAAAPPSVPKKIPLTPKQKLLHRMQSGELLSLSPPPIQQHQQQQPPPIIPSSLNFQQAVPQQQQQQQQQPHANSLLVENLQQPPQHQLDPYYENLLQNRDEFMPDNLAPLNSKAMEGDPNGVSVLYDPDAYNYYYGNMLGDEIFSTTTTTSSTTAAAAGRPVLMLPQGSGGLQDTVESLQSQTTHRHVEFILGIEDAATGPADLQQQQQQQQQHDRGRDENMPMDPTGQFLDAENLNKNPATDSTLRNLLMMGPMQHDDTAWISADYGTSSSRSRQGVSSHGGNINLSGSMSMSLNNSWILGNDWTRGSWGNGMASSMPQDVQDEVMDMSVMDSPEKQKLRQGHLVDHQDIDDVDLEGSGLPLLGSMPIDLQQPFSGVQGSSGLAGMPSGLKNGVLVHDNSGTMEGNPINLQQHQHRSQVMREDEEPVNLMSVNLENELAHGNHHGHHSALSTPTEEMDHMHSNNTVLQHSSSVMSSSSAISRHMSHLDRTIVDSKQVHCSSGGYITFHAAAGPPSSSSSCAPNDYQNSISDQLNVMANSENDHIDERRIIRVKKIKEGQLSPPDTSPSFSKMSNTPSIILDKPVQPKSIASLPCPLNLHPVNGKGYAVFTARYKTIAVNTRFGPVEGPLRRAYKEDITSPLSTYPLLVMSDNLNTLWQLDRTDDELCNWMKFVRAAQTPSEQNAVIMEDHGLLYFSTTKEIPPKTELLVGYSLEYAHKYSINVSREPSGHEQSDSSAQVTLPAEASIPEEPHQPVIVKDSLQNQLVVERENSVSSFSELFTCFECHEEFPSVSALNFHLEHSHRQQEAVIVRRPKKKSNLKKSKFLENSDPHDTSEDFSMKYDEEEHHRVEPKRSKYDCNSCGASFDTILALTNHAAEHYNEKVSQSVPEETSKEAEPSDLGMNALKEALTKPLVQPLVEKKEVATSSVLVVPTKVKCTMCYKSFATKDRLDKHMIVHSDEDTKPLQCEFCPKRFLTNSALAGHIKTHAEEGKCFECPMCVFVTQQLLQLKEHVQAHRNKESGMFHCPKCTKRFTMYSMVRKHIRAFHGPRQFACDQCAMCFPTSDKLKLHKLKHSDHREFLCAECGRQFKRKDKLREHTKRMHENKKKVIDSHSSATSSSKNRPSKKLVPKTPMEEFEKFVYKCSDCMMGFKRRGMLVNHLAKRHPDKPPEKVPELNLPILRPTRNYFCPYCDRVYKSSSKRKSHILKSHPGKALPPQLKGRMDSEKMMIKDDVAAAPSEIKELTPAQQQQYREVSVVGKVMATPHSCQWCHRQYATRAKLLQHQRKAHLHLMPPDMQYPRTQKNNVNRLADGSLVASSEVHISNDAESINSSGQVLNVPVVQIIKNDAFDQPSSSTVTVSLAPDSSTSTATQIASIGSSTTPTVSAVSTTGGPAGTTAITLNDQQLQQLQIHSVGGNGEETGNVIGFLLTTATVNGDIGTLVPSEFVVVPISQQQQQQQQQQQNSGQQEQQQNIPNQQQQQQQYPVLSAATMNAIHQTIINASGSSSSSNNNNGATPGATLVPMTSNSNNILSNVISTAVSGISTTTTTVNPIISPAE